MVEESRASTAAMHEDWQSGEVIVCAVNCKNNTIQYKWLADFPIVRVAGDQWIQVGVYCDVLGLCSADDSFRLIMMMMMMVVVVVMMEMMMMMIMMIVMRTQHNTSIDYEYIASSIAKYRYVMI